MDEMQTWLNEEIQKRGWSLRELARRSEISSATISNVLSGKDKPGVNFCNGIAKALNIPPEEIFRKAGLLPQLPPESEIVIKIKETAEKLPKEQQKQILDLAIMLYQRMQ